ncbi:MAG: TIGR02391 family protein [Acidobacteria bacterium]|nr:MAG: TIGR02391 family protein [Acidobacteriota bacterium]
MAALDETLRKLDINLSKEIQELDLPEERPRVVPPPYAFQKMVDELGLHPYLLPDCPRLFKDGHVNEAVRKALEKYEAYIQKKAGLHNIGTDLMANAFNENNPKIKVADVSTKRGRGLQEGFKFISMGGMGFWRNYCSHGDEEQMSHHDAISIIATISHLLNYIDVSDEK